MTSGLRGSDVVRKITESMKYHGLDVVIYDQVESNPKEYNVVNTVAFYPQNNCDGFVSIGGGSSHGACRGARVSVAHDGRNVNEFEGFKKSENPVLFNPVTVRRAEDKPRLVVLADVSEPVGAGNRPVHLAPRARPAGPARAGQIVADLAETTELFANHPVEEALGMVFGGDLLDVDTDPNYGLAFG